jgi:hypothetical protein
MKSSFFNLFVAVVVATLIIMSLLCSCATVRPYSPETVFAKQYPYEGFETLDYLNKNAKDSDSLANNHLMANQNATECKKVHGFNGLFCKPYVADSKIDKFSEAQGDAKCFGQSSGLSNSKGSLCLGNDLTRLLRTRGGNQTGGPDQY